MTTQPNTTPPSIFDLEEPLAEARHFSRLMLLALDHEELKALPDDVTAALREGVFAIAERLDAIDALWERLHAARQQAA